MSEKEWFATWFESEYYHTLYHYRDKAEAEHFIEHLIKELKAEKNSDVLDLACGRGRHSVTLHELGMNVLGADLSPSSIEEAKKHKTEGLDFIVHDMRDTILGHTFDIVLNLFTSFGYFDDKHDNQRVIHAIASMLKPGGMVVIDFLNAKRVIRELVPKETKKAGGIDFHISREFNGKHIIKHIRFSDKGIDHHYTEQVQALTLDDLKVFLMNEGLEIISTFGDFDLGPFDEENSHRLIIVAKNKK